MDSNDFEADLRSLGAFVRQRRRDLNLTQCRLAERVGWVQERVSVIENGKYGLPSLPMLAKLADALDVPQAEMLQSAGFLRDTPARPSMTPSGDLAKAHDRLAQTLGNIEGQLLMVEKRVQTIQALRDQIALRRAAIRQAS